MFFNPDKPYKLGSELTPAEQRYVLNTFVHRHTATHKPLWAMQKRPDGRAYKPQFASDGDWLAHTKFQVTKSGKVDRRACECHSSPTWPEGCE